MQIVIDIPEEMYKAIGLGANGFSNYLHVATRIGTPLPKGHGRLIDAGALLKEKRCFEDFDGDTFNIIHEEAVINADTIIEADIESGEE